jgi:hypothetical protein
MTQGSKSIALALTGYNSIYPNSASWGPSITFGFMSVLPIYYMPGFYTSLISFERFVDPETGERGVRHRAFSDPGLFHDVSASGLAAVTLAALGDGEILGFNNFTSANLAYSSTEIAAGSGPNIVFGGLSYSNVDASAITLAVGAELGTIWSEAGVKLKRNTLHQ